eukprot:1676914-Rhodomonas_salina.1
MTVIPPLRKKGKRQAFMVCVDWRLSVVVFDFTMSGTDLARSLRPVQCLRSAPMRCLVLTFVLLLILLNHPSTVAMSGTEMCYVGTKVGSSIHALS